MLVFCDEVGMASIMGPLAVCATATEDECPPIKGIKDSKKLSKAKREQLFPILTEKIIHAYGFASPKKIEDMNVFYARFDAMRIAVEKLVKMGVKIDKIIIDGNFIIPNLDFLQEAVIKADDKYWQCSAASILAKVKRDNLLTELSKIEKYSYYGLQNNAGYYTPEHKKGIILHGPTELHRENFGYFKYCLFCHEQYLELGSYEKYLEYEKEPLKHYAEWKEQKKAKYGEKEW